MNPTNHLAGLLMFILVVFASVAIFFYLIYCRWVVMRVATPINRFDRIGERIKAVVVFALGQRRILNSRFLDAGIMHAFIFWGFLVVSINSIHFIGRGFYPDFHLPFLGDGGALQLFYLYLRDIFEGLVLVMVFYALFRRLVIKPSRITLSADALLILGLICILMVTDLLMSGAKAHQQLEISPAGLVVSHLFENSSASKVANVFQICWWVHLVSFFFFLDYLPISKHFHVVTALFNVFFKSLEKGALQPIDIENAEHYGASKPHHFYWKDILDIYTCTECGRCQASCPAWATEKPLSPKEINESLRDYIWENTSTIVRNRNGNLDELSLKGDPMVGGVLSEDILWACTTCRACEEACPLFIEFIGRIVEMRRHLVLEESRFPKELVTTYKNLENNGNPWGIGASMREEWADELIAQGIPVRKMREVEGEVEVLFWVGCAGAFDDRGKKITREMVKILNAAKVDFAILGQEESCTGDTARRTGNEYLFQMLAESNIETLNNYKFKRILTQCPHCFNTLKHEYPQFGGKFEVVHHSEFINELIQQGRLRLKKPVTATVTYHDSCYLGRHNGIYSAPRQILKAIPELNLVELSRHGSNGFCCGAGGGWMWMEENLGSRINHNRVEEVIELQPNIVATACPFCLIMLDDGVKDKGQDERLKVLDIVQLVSDALEE
ncbi:(Fe-S)-binding protein [candidate division KSB1 bacterium]|nr:MAG: (Fe-S)-binding protein [candidate division KSB1 bacterium]